MRLATIGAWFTLLAASAAPFARAAPQSEPTPREWNQPWGNAASTSFVDVAPLSSLPSEKWRLASSELLAGPIVTQRRLFAAVKLDGKAQLIALDPDSGARIAAAPLDAVAEPLTLVGADGLVLLFDAKGAHGYRLSGGALALEKSVAGSFVAPTWGGGVLLAAKPGGGVQQLDWSAGKSVALAAKGLSRPGLRGGAVATISLEEKETKLALLRWPATVSGGAMKLDKLDTAWSGGLIAPAADAANAVLVGVPGREAIEWCAWFGAGKGGGMLRKAAVRELSFQAAPAAMGSRLYGFDSKEQLVEFDASSDGHRVLVEKAGLPAGGKVGAPSIARDVLYLGNWALELARKRVLWCKADLDVVGAVVPVGDERIVVATSKGQLVGYGRAEVAAAAGGRPRIPVATPTIVPGKEPGLVRADGIFVPGKVTALPDGRWKVEPKSGAAQEYEADWIALAETGDAPGKRTGEEIALHGAWWKVLAPAHAEGLVPAIEKYRDAKLVDEAKALLEEAKRYGLAPDRADALGASIPAKGGAKGKAASDAKKACDEIVADVREASWKACRAGARWCAERNSKVAASVLAARANELRPDEADLELVEDWVPPDFPEQAGLEDRIKQWLMWADALLPSGGSFATIDDALRRRLSVTKFKEGEALVFRTRNILLFSRENDPKVIGALLLRGEATIRALQKILGPSPQGLSPLTPLEVRLYRTKTEYLADGSSPPVWSAGCYASNDKTSRFYSSMGDKKSDPVQHTLEEVFAHELTHHYTDLRWVRETGKDPGSYWMVEGFAEFVAGQALEIGRIGDTFDDATAEAIDRAAAVARMDPSLLLDFQSFIDMDRTRFHGGELEGMVGTFKLKHTLSETTVDRRLLFYAQATALTFFVMNQCGEEGRTAYVKWLESVYSGKPLQTPWKDLGMGSPGEWKGKFVAWLKEA